jgi:hypothetical protein
VNGESPGEIAQAAGRLLADPAYAQRLGAAARRRALAEFDGTRQRSEFAAIVRQVARRTVVP